MTHILSGADPWFQLGLSRSRYLAPCSRAFVGGAAYGSLMTHRYRLYPTAEQSVYMAERHCRDARFVWNLAIEQFNWGGSGRSAPGSAERMRQLAEARQEFEWLRCGSSAVQQQALRDFDWAVRAFFNGTRGRPTWRKRGRHEGFCVRDTKVRGHGPNGRRYTYRSWAGCNSGCPVRLPGSSWAWRESLATGAAAGMSASPPRSRQSPTREGVVGRWESIAV